MDIDQEKVTEWLNTHWTESKTCPVCGGNDWITFEKAWELTAFGSSGGLVFGAPPALPVVAVMCNVCGYTLLFNAIAVRAVPRATEKEGEDHG